MTIVVIGSGPAGVAAAHALVGAGHRVTVLDAGDRIEPGRMSVFDALARLEPEQWPPQLAQQGRQGFPVGLKHVPLKPAYGSLFPYATDDPDLPVTLENAAPLPSLAYGGLSNAWGASILPYRQSDIEDWPISLTELALHYEAVLRFLPIAAEHDELSEIFPLYTDSPSSLRRGPQAQMLLDRLARHAHTLMRSGFHFGASRVAVVTSPEHPHHCRYSGMCMYGCPYHSIYAAQDTLGPLIDGGMVDYRGGVYVDSVAESDGAVTLRLHRRGRPAESWQMTAARVFVACGAISSTRLMLKSMRREHFSARLLDSQYFVVPMLTARAAPINSQAQGNTLAQVFLELMDPQISERSIHLQLYGYNDLILSAIARKLPLDAHRLEGMLRPLLGRMVIIQGYLHSDDSPELTIGNDEHGVRVVGDEGTIGALNVSKVVRRLTLSARPLGMLPMFGLIQTGLPGKGNHLGGSLPMRREPGELETDTLGRPRNWKRVHIVDSSVFPSVPATTVTLTVMANAHRIASAALQRDDVELECP